MNNLQSSEVKSDLRRRVSTALVMLGIFVLAIVLGMISQKARWILLLLGLLINFMCAWEFSGICICNANVQSGGLARGIKRNIYFLIAFFPSLILVLLQLVSADSNLFTFDKFKLFALCALLNFCSAFMALSFAAWLGRTSLQAAAEALRELLLGILLIGFGGSLLISLVFLQAGLSFILWLVAVVALNDIAAYFVGSQIQGPKLASQLSPSKTLSGSVGGLFAGLIAGTILYWLLNTAINWMALLLLGILAVIAAQLGDLSKSLLKRLHGVKDSGSTLPGHGGFLDRVDGILMACPVLYFWILFG